MRSILKSIGATLVSLLLVIPARAATVTTTYSFLTRPQNGITYGSMDFYYTMAPGAEFTNYTLTVVATSNYLHDPARLQDDRQYNSTNEAANSGSVDTFANTVMSSAAKEDGGFTATILADPAGYAPTGGGHSPGFTSMKWDVFDNVMGDDNDLSDHADGPFPVAAPYHIARVLMHPFATAFPNFLAYDTSQPGVAFPFNFDLVPDPHGPTIDLGNLNLGELASGAGVSATLPTGFCCFNYTLHSFAGPNGAVVGAAVNSSSGEFTWDTSGAAPGSYSAVVHGNFFVPDASGNASPAFDAGTLTFTIVPEPAAAALFAAALAAIAGIRRQRSIA